MRCDWCWANDGDKTKDGKVVKVTLVGIGNYRLSPLCQECAMIEQKGHSTTDTRTATASFKQGWQEAMRGETRPVEDLWVEEA